MQGMSNARKQATGQEGLLWSRSVQQLGGNTHKVGKGLCSSMNRTDSQQSVRVETGAQPPPQLFQLK